MKQVTLDAENDLVKQFVLSLLSDSEGSVLQLQGQPLLCVMPLPASQPGAAEEWTEAKNARRCTLVDQEIDGTLTPEEARELAVLQQAMLRHRRQVAPLPLEATRRLYDELLRQEGRYASLWASWTAAQSAQAS